jgi:hypothetical protein
MSRTACECDLRKAARRRRRPTTTTTTQQGKISCRMTTTSDDDDDDKRANNDVLDKASQDEAKTTAAERRRQGQRRQRLESKRPTTTTTTTTTATETQTTTEEDEEGRRSNLSQSHARREESVHDNTITYSNMSRERGHRILGNKRIMWGLQVFPFLSCGHRGVRSRQSSTRQQDYDEDEEDDDKGKLNAMNEMISSFLGDGRGRPPWKSGGYRRCVSTPPSLSIQRGSEKANQDTHRSMICNSS